MPAVRSRGRSLDRDNQPKPRSDAYTGLLLLALLAQVAGAVFLYIDWSRYPASAPEKVPTLASAPVTGGPAAPPAANPAIPPAAPAPAVPPAAPPAGVGVGGGAPAAAPPAGVGMAGGAPAAAPPLGGGAVPAPK